VTGDTGTTPALHCTVTAVFVVIYIIHATDPIISGWDWKIWGSWATVCFVSCHMDQWREVLVTSSCSEQQCISMDKARKINFEYALCVQNQRQSLINEGMSSTHVKF
jgi:hypothetical protein